MKNIILSLTLLLVLILFISTISADILLTQPKELYNLGDPVSVPTVIKTTKDVTGFLQMFLICNNQQAEFYKEYIFLSAGEEKRITPSFLLIKSLIGNLAGNCKIKAILKDEYALTNEFVVTDLINIELKTQQTEFAPGENIILEGTSTKANGEPMDGIIELNIISENIHILETVNNGYFLLNVSLPKDTPAGNHIINLKVYEKDQEGNITNQGFMDYNILVTQIPTSLEIVFENQEVEPGTNLKVRGILHDQTGEKIQSIIIISIKNKNNKIMKQTEQATDEYLEYPINYNEPPSEWVVHAVSNKLTNEATFTITEKQDARIEIINRTLLITNTGNVAYTKTILVKIGDYSENIDVNLKVDESKKYTLSAPDGKYEIEVISDGKSVVSESVVLTGSVVGIKEASGVNMLIRHPFVWVFITAIFGFVAYMFIKRGYKKTFFGYKGKKIKSEKAEKEKKGPETKELEKSLGYIKNDAELSLSLKGEKQDASLVCLKIKNPKEVVLKRGQVRETIQKIIELSKERKAFLYENVGYLFFIIAPIVTKTFRNEKIAVQLAQQIVISLLEHNRKFQDRIDFGISVDRGGIIAKKEKHEKLGTEMLKFMSLGNLISRAKKIASLSNQEVLLSKDINERLMSDVKTEKKTKDGVPVYTIVGIRALRNTEESKKFLSSFMKRMDAERKKQE